ncbi:putative nuclease HARBI1 [Myzus persicae]|uniref:putative nuclease HARBI1 n=1 Tax=Myzus persicae TaxID=13164 RepID=UPI000B93743E|nr:putative nuclease HARBI1 [Myzus persicae]
MSFERWCKNELTEIISYDFCQYVKGTVKTFRTLLRLIEADISPPSHRLQQDHFCKLWRTAMELGTGACESSACRHIRQVCRAIARYWSKFIYFPKNAVDMRKVVSGFYNRCRFPRVIRAVDCTHIKIHHHSVSKKNLIKL